MKQFDTEKMLKEERKKKIKKRFLKLFNMVEGIDKSLDVSQAKLAERFNVKTQTFKDSYNETNKKNATQCNAELVINFAHEYGIDPYDIMFTDIPEEELFEQIKVNIHEKKILGGEKPQLNYDERIYPLSSETHHSYFGNFYGYTINHKPTEDELLPFRLHIYETEDRKAVAEYSFYGEGNKKQVFAGVPYYISFKEAIAIEMTATKNRRYQYLYFNAAPYECDQITYKSGICVRTSRASRTSEPDAKSFIITKHELPENVVKQYVPGLLKMTGESFYVLKSVIDKLSKTKPEIPVFLDYYKNEVEIMDGAVYRINELTIIDNAGKKDISRQINAFEILTEIKAHSLATNRVLYRNTDADYNFFKNLGKNK